MKIKTSVTLSEDVLKLLQTLGHFKSRSDAIEQSILYFIQKKRASIREEKDLKILNKRAQALNEEAEDVLDYQVDL